MADAQVGDTIVAAGDPRPEALPGFRESSRWCSRGSTRSTPSSTRRSRRRSRKLQLNDASLIYEPETSVALGFGFRCGFLGLLHMEIVQERLRREYQLDLIATTPSVEYHVLLDERRADDGRQPGQMPPAKQIESIEEPYVLAHVLTPSEYLGNIMKLCQDRRGIFVGHGLPRGEAGARRLPLPLAEIVLDFYDRLKSVSRGYASLDYEFDGYQRGRRGEAGHAAERRAGGRAVGDRAPRQGATTGGGTLCAKLKELIPRQMFQVAIQAAIGGKVIARETISARSARTSPPNVTAVTSRASASCSRNRRKASAV